MTLQYKYIKDNDYNRDLIKMNNRFGIISEFKNYTNADDVKIYFNRKWNRKTLVNVERRINSVPANKILVIDVV